jgi:hypothetical protein
MLTTVMGRRYLAEHAFAASENWPLGWEGWDSACRGRPPAKNTKHNESMKRVISLANLVRVAPMVVQGVVHVAQEQAPTAMRKTLGRDPNCRRRHLVAVTTPAVLERQVGRINRGRREPGRHGCGESPGAANHRVQRITGCGEAPESLEKRQRIRNILAKRTSSWEGGWGAGSPDFPRCLQHPQRKRTTMQTVSVKPWPENELRTKIDGEVVFEKPRPVLWSLVRLRFLLTGGPATQRKTQAEDKKEAARAKHPAEPHLDGGGRCRETPQSKNR